MLSCSQYNLSADGVSGENYQITRPVRTHGSEVLIGVGDVQPRMQLKRRSKQANEQTNPSVEQLLICMAVHARGSDLQAERICTCFMLELRFGNWGR